MVRLRHSVLEAVTKGNFYHWGFWATSGNPSAPTTPQSTPEPVALSRIPLLGEMYRFSFPSLTLSHAERTRGTEVKVLSNFQPLSKRSRKEHFTILGPFFPLRSKKKSLPHHDEEVLARPTRPFLQHPLEMFFRIWNYSDILWSNCSMCKPTDSIRRPGFSWKEGHP